ncbi:MAG TPA: transcriptional repressor LexA [Terriglobales bacterium]|nr:transcriptional repressor LexA [Terriglobales bacterium]
MVLTKRQHQVLSFLQEFMEREGYCPSYEEIAAGLKLSSLATVHAHLAKLEKKGCLRRSFNQSRSIELRRMPAKRPGPASLPQSLPLLGRIAAGAPMEAVEGAEEISLGDIVGNRATFVLEVRGQSMIEDHIMDGDYVMVERREQAEDGQIVVALVDGVEATLKRLYHEKGGMLRLQPANSAMPPIRVAARRVQIQGRVIGVLRKY